MIAHATYLGVGFHDGVPAASYHGDPCERPSLSSSIAVDLIAKSPAHARLAHPRLSHAEEGSVREETAAMAFGSVVHEIALGRGGGFAIWEGDTWRGNAAQAFREGAMAVGQTPIKRADFDRASCVVTAARSQLYAMGLGYVLDEGQSEQVAIWKNGDQYARAMFDKWLPDRREIWDIKTTGKSAHPEQIARMVPSMNYDMRSEFYLMGASALTGIPARPGGLGYQFLFFEVNPPYCVTPCFLDDALRARGRRRAQEAVDTWARCMDADTWPGYADRPVEITAPGWVDYEIEDSEITTTGERVV